MGNSHDRKLRSFPVQLIPRKDAIILKRGAIELRIAGEGASEALGVVISTVSEGGYSEEDVCELFAAPSRPAIRELLKQLLDRRIFRFEDELGPSTDKAETPLDVFYWHFDLRPEQVANRINEKRLAIVGVNHISCRLANSLATCGLDNFEIVDYELLRNLHLFGDGEELNDRAAGCLPKRPIRFEEWQESARIDAPDCIIATSDFGGQQLLLYWNDFCIANKCNFLPVLLQDLVGYVGPLVVPGETACLECLRARQNANLMEPRDMRLAEESAFDAQGIAGFHPAMASVLAEVAAFELTKFYGSVPQWRVGSMIEVNLFTSKMTPHKVLKVPRCKACSTLNRRPSASLKKSAFVQRIRTE